MPVCTLTSFGGAGKRELNREMNEQHSGVVRLIATLGGQLRPHPAGHAQECTVSRHRQKHTTTRGLLRTFPLFFGNPKLAGPPLRLSSYGSTTSTYQTPSSGRYTTVHITMLLSEGWGRRKTFGDLGSLSGYHGADCNPTPGFPPPLRRPARCPCACVLL